MEVPALVVDDRVHRAAYVDPAVYARELRTFWAHTWQYLAHASQVPNPGDVITVDVAGRPLMLVRQADGGLRVLAELRETLKPGGVLFSSNPRGHGEEGWNGARYGVYHDLEGWRRHMTAAGFIELDHYYRPAGLPRAQQPWLASIWRASRA